MLLKKAHRLLDRDLALAAAMNHPTLPVHRRPKVALLATGDELVMPGTTPGPGQIVYSNGGASVGDHDVVKQALESEGVKIAFWKIAMRPGKPMMHGRRGGLRVLGLPGNPVSSYVCAILFMAPLIRALIGRTDIAWPLHDAVLGRDVPANDLREDYLRASLAAREGSPPLATPVSHQDSSLLANLSRAAARTCSPRWRALPGAHASSLKTRQSKSCVIQNSPFC